MKATLAVISIQILDPISLKKEHDLAKIKHSKTEKPENKCVGVFYQKKCWGAN